MMCSHTCTDSTSVSMFFAPLQDHRAQQQQPPINIQAFPGHCEQTGAAQETSTYHQPGADGQMQNSYS